VLTIAVADVQQRARRRAVAGHGDLAEAGGRADHPVHHQVVAQRRRSAAQRREAQRGRAQVVEGDDRPLGHELAARVRGQRPDLAVLGQLRLVRVAVDAARGGEHEPGDAGLAGQLGQLDGAALVDLQRHLLGQLRRLGVITVATGNSVSATRGPGAAQVRQPRARGRHHHRVDHDRHAVQRELSQWAGHREQQLPRSRSCRSWPPAPETRCARRRAGHEGATAVEQARVLDTTRVLRRRPGEHAGRRTGQARVPGAPADHVAEGRPRVLGAAAQRAVGAHGQHERRTAMPALQRRARAIQSRTGARPGSALRAVSTLLPERCAASTRQERTSSPSSRTRQWPHWPASHPVLTGWPLPVRKVLSAVAAGTVADSFASSTTHSTVTTSENCPTPG
jgi:hypothetical protein